MIILTLGLHALLKMHPTS